MIEKAGAAVWTVLVDFAGDGAGGAVIGAGGAVVGAGGGEEFAVVSGAGGGEAGVCVVLGAEIVTWTTVVGTCAGVVVGVGVCTGVVGVSWLYGVAMAVSDAATRLGVTAVERVVGVAIPVKVRRVVISVVDAVGVEAAGVAASGVDAVGADTVVEADTAGADTVETDAVDTDAVGPDTVGLDTAGADASAVDAGVLSTTVVWTVLAVAAPVAPTIVDTEAVLLSPDTVAAVLAIATVEAMLPVATVELPVKLISLAVAAEGLVPSVTAAS